MIENGNLVHGEIDSSLQAWQPDSFVVTGLILAVLATVLAMQATSLVYDLFLGIKKRGQVPAPDMHMLLLAEEASPLSIAAAVFRRDDFDRARFYGDIPRTTTIVRSRARVGSSTAIKLFFVLLTAPLVNLIAIFLALERDEDVSFAEAGFSPVAFGYDRFKNRTLERDIYGAECFRLRTSFSHAADEHAQFFYCFTNTVRQDLDEPAENTELTLTALPNGQLRGTLRVADLSVAVSLTLQIDMLVDENVYRIAQQFTQADLQNLATSISPCFEFEEITPETQRSTRASGILKPTAHIVTKTRFSNAARQSDLTASNNFSCATYGPLKLAPISKQVALLAAGIVGGFKYSSDITLVDTDIFRVVNTRDLPNNGGQPSWFDGKDLTLLKRRTHYVPVGIFLLVVGILVVIRLIVECVTNNDVHDGVDDIVARNVGLSNSYSMIRSDGLIRYDHKYQRGLTAQYGVRQPGQIEVTDFKGGTLGFEQEEDPLQRQMDSDASRYYGEEVMNPTLID